MPNVLKLEQRLEPSDGQRPALDPDVDRVELPNGHTVQVVGFEQARRMVTASAVGAIIGASPYADQADVYAKIVHGHTAKPSRYMKAGLYFESGILQWYADETGERLTLWDQRYTAVSEVYDFLGATPDAFGSVQVVDAKNPGYHQRDQFQDGTVPPGYYAQLQVQAFVTKYPYGQLAPVIGGNDLRPSELFPVDDEYVAWVLDRVAKFWHDHVVPQRPPKARTKDQAAVLFPKHTPGRVLVADAQVAAAYLAWRNAKAEKKKAVDLEKELGDLLATYVEDAEAVTMPDGTKLYTYKANKDGVAFDLEAWAESEPEAFAQYEAAQTRYTRTKPGARVMRDAGKGSAILDWPDTWPSPEYALDQALAARALPPGGDDQDDDQ